MQLDLYALKKGVNSLFLLCLDVLFAFFIQICDLCYILSLQIVIFSMRRKKQSNFFKMLKYHCVNFYSEYKTLLLFALAMIAVGMLIGFICAGKNPQSFYQSNFITGIKLENYKIGAEFLKFFLFGLVGLALIYIGIFAKWLRLLAWALLVFCGFKFAVAVVGLFAEGFLGGLICFLLFYLPLFLSLIIVFCAAYALICAYTRSCGGCFGVMSSACHKAILIRFAILEGILFVVCILFALLIPSIYRLIIVF